MSDNESFDKTEKDTLNKVSTTPRKSPKTFTVSVPNVKIPEIKMPSSEKGRYTLIIVAFIIASILSGLLGGLVFNRSQQNGILNTSLSNQKKIVTSSSILISQIAKTVGPSVVSVNVSITQPGSNTSGFGLFGFSQPEQEQAAGTGIIIDSKGLILTNRHVVPLGTTSVSITLSDGTELKDVTVLGRTSSQDSLDVAFLKINNLEGHKLVPAAIGNSTQVQVGDSVVAIGNALGQFQNTVTSGIISGYGRSVTASAGSPSSNSTTSASNSENLNDLFQTDAAINEGNSGGPLVNLNGQVIAMNTAVAGNAQNIGFAIPINDIKGLIDQVLANGKFSMPYLGVRYIPLTADVANEFGVKVQSGAFIAPSSDSNSPSVIPGSPAESAGLKVNDVITSVNGVSVDQGHSLTSLLDQYKPGDTITLSVNNGNGQKTVKITLGTSPNN